MKEKYTKTKKPRNMIPVAVTMPAELEKAARQHVKEQDLNLSQWVRGLIRRDLSTADKQAA